MIILTCAGSLPGYWTAILTVDNLGRKSIQVVGFLILTVIFCILGFAYHRLTEMQFLVLYVVAQFFFNWGPNTTTFIVPGECFPTRYRSTGHGISAAMGKVGAIAAQVICVPLLGKDAPEGCEGGECSPWVDRLMQIFALFMLCGLFVSLLIPETKGATLEELAGEAPTAGRPSWSSTRKGSRSSGAGGPQRGSWWDGVNPFIGGQPAGFSYERLTREWKRREKSMTETSGRRGHEAKEMERKTSVLSWHNRLSWKKGRATSSSEGSSGYAASVGSSGKGLSPKSVMTDEMPMTPPRTAMPSWGAGWGRVERSDVQPATPIENIRLQDVGSLLE